MKKKGFALIEILISVFILATVGIAVAGSFVSAIKSVTYAKDVIAATALANEEMETLHNLPYNSLATLHGVVLPLPANPLPDDKTITRSGLTFNVHTNIVYFDDPYDGLSPADTAPYDYKKVSVSVSLNNQSTYLAILSTNIGAKAAETLSNTGILLICAIKAPFPYNNNGGTPVGSAQVSVTNTDVTPPVNIVNALTDVITGCLMIPNLPPDAHNRYHVVVTKDGYSTDMTYKRTSQSPNVPQPDLDVLSQQVTSKTFIIDQVSTLNLQFNDPDGNAIPNVAFKLTGAKIKYNNPDTPKFSQSYTAGADGKITIPNLEFDDYTLSDFPGQLAALSPAHPIMLYAGVTLSAIATLAPSADTPTITNISPSFGSVGQTVTIEVLGDRFQNGLVAKLYRIPDGSPRTEILGTTTFVDTNKITTKMNLTGAATGKWNLEITNPNGKKVVLFNGFEVKN